MRITNRHHLPQPIVDAVSRAEAENQQRRKERGEYNWSVTELIDAPFHHNLAKLVGDNTSRDVTEMANTLLGGVAVHEYLDKYVDPETCVKEMPVSCNLQLDGTQYRITGQIDLLYRDGDAIVLVDYKTANVWSKLYSDFEDPYDRYYGYWAQVNIYRYFIHKMVARGEIKVEVATLRCTPENFQIDSVALLPYYLDWRPGEAANPTRMSKNLGHKYPKSRLEYLPLNVWPIQQTEMYLAHRIRLHLEAQRGAKYACDTKETWGGKRCTDYCLVAEWCQHGSQQLGTEILPLPVLGN